MEEGDWDLQAVVRGCGGGGVAAAASRDPFFSFPPPLLVQDDDGGGVKDNDLLFCFPNLLGTETSLQELEQLYKPFFPQSSPPQPPPQQQKMAPLSLSSAGSPIPSPSSSSAVSLLSHTGGFTGAMTQQRRQQQQRQQQHHRSLSSQGTTATRSKRRKNQQKRVVCHVPADSLSSDMWAWRKYGQKPIKGSPYPRGYYRCSSSKGCLARKQVERSRTDPGVFVITYSAEHNHPVPTHRNSLAGSTRHKFTQTTSISSPTTTNTNTQHVNFSGGDNSVSHSSLSPTTPLTSSMEEELLLTVKKEGRGVEGELEGDEDEEEGMLLVSDMEMLGEDDVLFLGLDDVHHPSSDNHFQTPLSASPWMANSNTTAAAGGD